MNSWGKLAKWVNRNVYVPCPRNFFCLSTIKTRVNFTPSCSCRNNAWDSCPELCQIISEKKKSLEIYSLVFNERKTKKKIRVLVEPRSDTCFKWRPPKRKRLTNFPFPEKKEIKWEIEKNVKKKKGFFFAPAWIFDEIYNYLIRLLFLSLRPVSVLCNFFFLFNPIIC